MGPQPTAPAGRVREPLVIAATFGPLVILRLLPHRRPGEVKRRNFALKSKKKKKTLKGDAM